jgi:hypothetical protein
MRNSIYFKTILLILLCFVFFLPLASAQFDSGTWYFGANTAVANLTGSFHSTSEGHEPDIRNIVINLEPSVGLFIINRLLLSVNADFSYADLRSSDDWKMTANAYTIGPAVTYYIGHGWFRPYVSAGTSFGTLFSKIRTSVENSNEQFDLVDFQGKAGLGIFPTENFSVNTGLRFHHLTYSESKPSANNISVFVGIGIYL